MATSGHPPINSSDDDVDDAMWKSALAPSSSRFSAMVVHLFVISLAYVILVVWTSFGANECPKK